MAHPRAGRGQAVGWGWGQPLTQCGTERQLQRCGPAHRLQERFSDAGRVTLPPGRSLHVAGHFPGLPCRRGSFVGKTFLPALFAAGVAMVMLPGWRRREEALTSPWEGSPVPRALAAFQVRQVGNRACNRSCFEVGGRKAGRAGSQASGWGWRWS